MRGLDGATAPPAAGVWPPRSLVEGAVSFETAAVPPPPAGSSATDPDGSWLVAAGPATTVDVDGLLDRLRRDTDGTLGAVSHLAVAWWNGPERRLTLARTPGASPTLHLRSRDGRVEFAERLSDLVRPGDRLDRVGIATRLSAGKAMTTGTIVEGIRAVAPGECVVVGAGGESSRWLRPPDWPESAAGLDRSTRLGRIREAFSNALQRAIDGASEPVLALSGGIDSTLIAVGLAAWLGIRPTTYTVRFPAYEGRFDEFEAADVAARSLGLRHESVVLRPDFLVDHLDWMVGWFDGPVGYAVHTSDLGVVSGGDILFSGAGGDSWSLGRNQRHGLAVGRVLPNAAARGIGAIAARGAKAGVRGSARLRDVADYAGDLPTAMAHHAGGALDDGVVDELLGDAAGPGRRRVVDYVATRAEHVGDLPPSVRLKYLNGFMAGPATGADWVLRWTRAYGMRPGLPFYEPTLNRTLATMVTDPGDRVEWRDLVAEHVPAEAAYRRKVGQSVPLAEWFRGPLRDLAEDVLSTQAVADDGVFDPSAVRRLVDEHMAGGVDHHWALLTLVTLSRWKRLVLDPQNRGGAPGA